MGRRCEREIAPKAPALESRTLWLEDAAQGCRNRRFRSPARQGHGTPKRGYSPRNRVRQLPQWGHRGRAASRSAASSTARSAGSVSSLNASERLDILSGCAGVGRRRQDQEQPGTIGLVSLRGVPEPVVSDLVKAARQDVLEEAPEELNARQPLDAPRVGAAIFPAEGHMGLVHAENPCVADGRAKDIPRQIGQHGVVTVAVVLAEGDPLPPPDVSRDGRENGRRRGLQGRANCAAILRERASTGTRNSRRAGSQCWPSGVIPPPVISRWTWG